MQFCTFLLQTGYERRLEKAKITLNDCLACSGCITSAESVLITQQSQDELYRILQANKQLIEVRSDIYGPFSVNISGAVQRMMCLHLAVPGQISVSNGPSTCMP